MQVIFENKLKCLLYRFKGAKGFKEKKKKLKKERRKNDKKGIFFIKGKFFVSHELHYDWLMSHANKKNFFKSQTHQQLVFKMTQYYIFFIDDDPYKQQRNVMGLE